MSHKEQWARIDLPNSVTKITALDDDKLDITYANGTHSIVSGDKVEPVLVGTTIPSQSVSIDPDKIMRDSFEDTYNKIENLTKRLSQLEDSVNKKQTARDITFATMRAYTKLLLTKLNDISTNQQTQDKVRNISALIERKIMEDVLS